ARNGLQLAGFTWAAPTAMMNSTIPTLIATTTAVTRPDSLAPSVPTTPSSSTTAIAPRVTGWPATGTEVGRPSRSPAYSDQPTDTTEAARVNSRIRSQPMIQAMNSPRVA